MSIKVQSRDSDGNIIVKELSQDRYIHHLKQLKFTCEIASQSLKRKRIGEYEIEVTLFMYDKICLKEEEVFNNEWEKLFGN